MPGSEELNIVLRLVDEASEKLKASLQGVQEETKKIKKPAEESGKSLKQNFAEAGKELRTFRRAMFAVTAEVAFIIMVTKEWAKHNTQTRDAYDSLGISIGKITALIGSLFAPTIVALANLLTSTMGQIQGLFSFIQQAWTRLFSSLSYGIQYIVSFSREILNGSSIIKAHRIAVDEAKASVEAMTKEFAKGFTEDRVQAQQAQIILKNYSEDIKNLELLFKSGGMTSQEYFDNIIKAQNDVIEQNTIIADQLREYVTLTAEVSNNELMNFEASMQGRMDLLTTYKDMYMQGHADMFAFGNMLANEFHSNMSSALVSIITGEKKASEAFKEFGASMVKAVVDYMVQQAIAFVISQVMQKIIWATTNALAISLAQAWAPAAALASLATLGGNSAPAIAGMSTAVATAYALGAPKDRKSVV